MNRDGFDDLIIGASSSTDSYVVFGQSSGFDPRFDLSSLDGSNGFTLNGVDLTSGNAVSNAGDVNGDGVDDLIIGARSADPNGIGNAGESYVVFGLNNNNDPDAVDDTATTDKNTPVPVDVLANDTDPDGDSLTVTEIDTTGTIGFVRNDNGLFFYDPNGQFDFLNAGEIATDSFTYTIDDGNGGTDTATVTITIQGNIPDITTDAYTTFSLDASDFITDPDGDLLTYSANLGGGEPLPNWLSLDETTGVFSGLPVNTNEGTLSIEVTADDNNGGIFTDSFDLTIERPLNPTANIINGDDSNNNLCEFLPPVNASHSTVRF